MLIDESFGYFDISALNIIIMINCPILHVDLEAFQEFIILMHKVLKEKHVCYMYEINNINIMITL